MRYINNMLYFICILTNCTYIHITICYNVVISPLLCVLAYRGHSQGD